MKRELSAIKARLGRVDERLDKVDARLDRVDARLEKVDERLDKADTRMESMETVMRRMWITVTDFRAEVTEFMHFVRKNMVTRKEFDTRFEKFSADIAAAQRDREIVSKSHMEHQRRLDDHEKRLTRLEAKRA